MADDADEVFLEKGVQSVQDMDAILKEAGSCGYYQVVHIIFTQLPRFLAIWALSFMIFGGYDPGWRFVNNTFQTNTDDIQSIHFNRTKLGINSSKVFYNNSYVQNRINSPGHQISYNGTCPNFESNCTDYGCYGIEFNPESRTIVSEFYLICDRAYIVKLIILLQSMGFVIGPLIGGQVGEKFGRKISLYGCTLIIGIASAVSIFSTHWVMFAVCCFFIGAATNSIFVVSPIFCMELLNSKWRGYYNALPTSNLAMIFLTVFSFLIKDWRYLHVITCFISLFTFCMGCFILPESPRWLLMNDRVKSTNLAVKKIAKFNKKAKQADMESFIRLHKAMKSENSNKSHTIIDILRNKQLVAFVFRSGFGFLITSASSQGITFGVQALPGQFYLNAILASVTELIVALSTGPTCNLIGRRLTGLAIGISGLLSCVMVIISLTVFEGLARIWVANVFMYFARALWQSAISVHSTCMNELLPTVVRSVVVGLVRFVGGFGAIIAPLMIPSKDTESLVIVFGCVGGFYCMLGAIFMSFRETRGFGLADGITTGKVLEVHNAVDKKPKNKD